VTFCKRDSREVDTEQRDTSSISDTEDNKQSQDFEELVSDYESADRVIWQKPDLVISLIGDLKEKVVADIGAGTGYFAFRIADQGGKVIAIDIDQQAIEWMEKEKTRYPERVQESFQTRLASESDPGISPGEVDIILMVNTYIYLKDRISYFSNLKNGLRKPGRIVIIDFKKKSTPIGPDPNQRIPLDQVEKELNTAGYQIISTDDSTLDYQYIITAKLPG
jgi:SAM-dependent methyltransferase